MRIVDFKRQLEECADHVAMAKVGVAREEYYNALRRYMDYISGFAFSYHDMDIPDDVKQKLQKMVDLVKLRATRYREALKMAIKEESDGRA